MGLFAKGMYALVSRWAARDLQFESTDDETEEGRERRRIGKRGEALAYWFLRRQGYTVIRRNYRSLNHHGEIDLIAWDGPVLVFAEVKTRTTEKGNLPEERVDHNQRKSLQAMARGYLKRRGWTDVPYRFDIVAIDARAGRLPQVRLYREGLGR